MPFNLLLLPLLGGYIFVRFWNFSRITILRADKDRIIIRSSLAGLFALFAAFAVSILIPQWWPCTGVGCLYSWWKKHIPFEYAGVSFIAFWIGAVGWIPLNLFYSRERAIARAIAEDADPLELLLVRSKDEGLSVAITLSNEKVYVGLITHQFNPATPTSNIGLLPLQSGYRDPVTKQLWLKVNYANILSEWNKRIDELADEIEYLESQLKTELAEDDRASIGLEILRKHQEWDTFESNSNKFEVILPVSQIRSAFIFDEGIYKERFRQAKGKDAFANTKRRN